MSVIIIAVVTITVVISASFWMGALSASFTRFEKIEIIHASVIYSGYNYSIIIKYINTGSSSTSLDSILLNDIPCSGFTPKVALGGNFSLLPSACEIGVDKVGTLTFQSGTTDPSGNKLSAGITIVITLLTTGGKRYHTSVTLD